MTKEADLYISKPWELSGYFVRQWQERGKLLLPFTGVEITMAVPDQVEEIVNLTAGNVALVGVGTKDQARQTIGEFVMNQRGLVATKDRETVSFQGLGLWAFGLCELRSARTKSGYEGMGINMMMKKLMIYLAYRNFGWPFIGFTEAASGSRGILKKLGFSELPMSQVHSGLAQVCPKPEEFGNGQDHCALRNGGDCGCKVYQLDIMKEKNAS